MLVTCRMGIALRTQPIVEMDAPGWERVWHYEHIGGAGHTYEDTPRCWSPRMKLTLGKSSDAKDDEGETI